MSVRLRWMFASAGVAIWSVAPAHRTPRGVIGLALIEGI